MNTNRMNILDLAIDERDLEIREDEWCRSPTQDLRSSTYHERSYTEYSQKV